METLLSIIIASVLLYLGIPAIFPHNVKLDRQVPYYIVFSVDNFNMWFNDRDNQAIYANPGIFLRLDKLGVDHVEDYARKCYGMNDVWVNENSQLIREFEKLIRKDWKLKIDNR